jgi:hypothetical protein
MIVAQTQSPVGKLGWKMSWAKESSELPISTSRFTVAPSLSVHQTRRTLSRIHPMSSCYIDVDDSDRVATTV